jgi:hypothetical protein
MSKYNAFAHDPAAVEITRDWLRRESPLVFIYAPSGKGKTTLLGSLFRHSLYHRVLLLDLDQGSTTIAEYTTNPTICERRVFNRTPSQRVGWFNEQIKYARTAECGAIIVEGFTSIHTGMVSANLEDVSDPEGPAAMRAHIGPSNRTGAMIESFRATKQHRLASGAGVPIIVTLNTRFTPIDPSSIDSPKKVVPDWSPNLVDKAMRAADAFIELDRNAHGTVLYTQQTPTHTARKLRACVPFEPKNAATPNAAKLVQEQVNLDLPGLFALWADCDAKMATVVAQILNPNTQS